MMKTFMVFTAHSMRRCRASECGRSAGESKGSKSGELHCKKARGFTVLFITEKALLATALFLVNYLTVAVNVMKYERTAEADGKYI